MLRLHFQVRISGDSSLFGPIYFYLCVTEIASGKRSFYVIATLIVSNGMMKNRATIATEEKISFTAISATNVSIDTR